MKALEKQEQAKAARKLGGDAHKAYSQVMLLAETLGAVAAVESNPEAKAAWASALQSLYHVEYLINKAIGTSAPKAT